MQMTAINKGNLSNLNWKTVHKRTLDVPTKVERKVTV